MRAFARVSLQFAAGRAEAATVGIMPPFHQQNAAILVKGIQQRGDFVGQRHGRSEAIERLDF